MAPWNPDNVPQCLRDRDQWVVWRFVERAGKRTKCPLNARTGLAADSTDSATWSSFADAAAALRTDPRNEGVGFVFSAEDPFLGIDLDDCIEPSTGELKAWGKRFVDLLSSYSEISPSGGGVKVIVRGHKPGPRCKKAFADGAVEMYDQDRFFTVTGRRMDIASANVEPRQEELELLYAEVFGSAPAPIPVNAASIGHAAEPLVVNPGLSDDAIIEKARRSRKSGTKFAALWAGNWEGHFGSQSEADSSLVFTSAFYTKDAGQIDRIFRRSGLMRVKWDERHGARTYGQQTIDNALVQVTGQWAPVRRGGPPNPVPADAGSARWRPTHLSQQVNAERLVRLLAGDARFNVNLGQWLCFDGTRYAIDHVGRIARAAKRVARETWRFVAEGLEGVDAKVAFKHATESEKAAGIAAMMKLAETEEGIPAKASDFDADPFLFNCVNGVVDLRRGSLRAHDRKDLITKLSPVRFDRAHPRPLFDAFMLRIMANQPHLVAYLQRVLGRCLSGDISEQELYFLIGEGANGKSVLVDTVLGTLGDYAGVAAESLLTVQSHNEHPTEIADLCGKRLVVASETEEGARLKVQLVKRLTGDSRIKGRFMRQDFFEFDRTHKLIIVSNNKPLIRETKHAIWRRIRLVPFSVIIPEAERDPQLTEKLKAERPGILAWLVEGCLDWQRRGMRTPSEVKGATQAYQREQDPLADYLSDRCMLGDAKCRISRNDVFADYLSWCQQTGERLPLSRNALFDHLRSLQGVSEGQWRMAGQSAPTRGFLGLGLAVLQPHEADLGE